MKKPPLSERLRYAFDNTLSRGPIALVVWLALATVIIVLAATLVDLLIGGVASQQGLGPLQVLWSFVFQVLVPNPPGLDTPWQFLVMMLVVTVVSLVGVSFFIGLMTSTIADRLDSLRRGRSRVIEEGHTLILGWSSQVFTIIAELAQANRTLRKSHATRRRACIVILANEDKVEMEEEIRTKVGDLHGTRVICRSGSPLDPDDLKIVSPDTARAIIIVSPGGQYPDLPIAKAMMALAKGRDRRQKPYHIVAALHRPTNRQIVRIISGDEASVFLVDGLISRIIAQTCRQPGLSAVYGELLSFAGAAIYFHEEPALAGSTYGEALVRYEDSAVMGLQHGDGGAVIGPPMETPIAAGDRLIALTAAADAITLSRTPPPPIDADEIRDGQTAVQLPERLLILGWNRRGPLVLEQLASYIAPGSQVEVVAAVDPAQMRADCANVEFQGMQVTFRGGNPQDRTMLERLVAEGHQYVVILSPSDTMELQIADAATAVTLLHIRDIAAGTGRRFAIVSEILDERNRDLAEVTSADDVIVSERLIALALAQIAENKDTLAVFADLLAPEGTEIYLKPAQDYVVLSRPVTFYTAVEAARRKGETAIGYRLLSEVSNPQQAYGVHLNPAKSVPITFYENDQVIVLAESQWR